MNPLAQRLKARAESENKRYLAAVAMGPKFDITRISAAAARDAYEASAKLAAAADKENQRLRALLKHIIEVIADPIEEAPELPKECVELPVDSEVFHRLCVTPLAALVTISNLVKDDLQ